MNSSMIPYGRQSIDEDDIEAVVRVLRSDYLTTGPEVDAFEQELTIACGARHAVAVANGTAALHCAYAAAGIGEGDEVITSPLTFSATANMVLAVGARPRFVDVDPNTLTIDVARVVAAIGPKTRAIAAVDFAGNPAPILELRKIAEERGLILVEDGAHSLGTRVGDRAVGGLAHLTTFSFHPVKTITTGEGGAITTDDDDLALRMRDFRNHGLVRTAERLERNDGPWYYEIQSLGFNYRLSALQCALGRSQLKKLPEFVRRRSQIVKAYRHAFEGDERLRMISAAPGAEPAWHLFAIRLRSRQWRERVFRALQTRGILPQVHYVAVNDMPHYRRLGFSLNETPVAAEAADTLLSLPLFPALSDEDVSRVIVAVRQALDDS